MSLSSSEKFRFFYSLVYMADNVALMFQDAKIRERNARCVNSAKFFFKKRSF